LSYDYKTVKAIEQSLRKKYPLNDAIIKNEILPLDKYKFKSAYGNSYFKGIKKSIINFLAYMEPNIARSSFLKDARHDIYNSSKNIELSIDNPAPSEPVFPLYAIDEKFIPFDIIPSNNTDFFHSIIVSLNPKDKSIIGVAILFSKIIHAFKLSTNYEGDVATTYIYNCMPLGIGSNRTKILEKNGPVFKVSDMKSSTDPQYINKKIKTNFNKLFNDLSSKARSTYFVNRMQKFFDMHPVPKGKVCEHINEIETAFFYILQDFAYAIHQDVVVSYAPITDLIKFASARLAHEIPIHLQNKKVSQLQIQFGLIAFEYFKEMEPFIRDILRTKRTIPTS